MKRIISFICVILTLSFFTVNFKNMKKSELDKATILFIGNSLTYVGKLSEQFTERCSEFKLYSFGICA